MAQLVFRDGPREVPEHVAAMLVGIDFYKLTYDEAIDAANRRVESTLVTKVMTKMINEHFRSFGARR